VEIPVSALDGNRDELRRSVEFSDDTIEGIPEQSLLGLRDGFGCGENESGVDVETRVSLGSRQLDEDYLQSDVEVFADLESLIRVFDRGYLDYDRFCEMKQRGEDFVTLLRAVARLDILESVQEVDITDETGTRSVSDQRVELPETGEQFRRIVFGDAHGNEMEYLTTLASSEYDPVEVISIYTLRTVIEILFRELKQYTSAEQFHSQSLNSVLFELFCTLIGYVLVQWFRQRHPLRGGVPEGIRKIRTRWNQSLPLYG